MVFGWNCFPKIKQNVSLDLFFYQDFICGRSAYYKNNTEQRYNVRAIAKWHWRRTTKKISFVIFRYISLNVGVNA